MKDTEEKEVQVQPQPAHVPAEQKSHVGDISPGLPPEYSHCFPTGKVGAAAWRQVTGKQGRASRFLMRRRGPELCPPGDDANCLPCCPSPAGWGKPGQLPDIISAKHR